MQEYAEQNTRLLMTDIIDDGMRTLLLACLLSTFQLAHPVYGASASGQ
jgi:hypothetical protein